MKIRMTILIAVVALLLLGTAAQSSRPSQSLEYTVQAVTVSGGSYQLTSLGPEVNRTSRGGSYRLVGSSIPAASSDGGCCCTYLPCVVR